MAVWTGNDCHSLWRRKLSHGGAESSPRSHDQHMATNARLKTKASCLTWALLLDRWEMSHFELPSEVLSMLAFCISHAGGLRWRYPLTWFSALPLSKAGKKKNDLIHQSTPWHCLPLPISSLEPTLPCYAAHSSVWWLAGHVHMSVWVPLVHTNVCMCVHTRPKPSIYTPQHSIPGLLSVFCVCGMCIHVHSHVWQCMCGSQRLMAGVFLNCSLLYLLLQGLLLNPAFTDSVRWPAHPEDLLWLPLEASGLQAGSHTH